MAKAENTNLSEYYLRDAAGSDLGVIDLQNNKVEWYVFGLDRTAKIIPGNKQTATLLPVGQTTATFTKTATDPFDDPYKVFANTALDSIQFYIYDHLGNTRLTYFANKPASSWRYHLTNAIDYYPYGKTMKTYNLNTAERYQSTGHERDTETGWDHRLARLYDADVGRFLAVDPMAEKRIWLNPYNYMKGSPISRIDPTGALDTKYEDELTGELIEDVDDGINQTVKVNKEQYTYMKDKMTSAGLDMNKKTDAFVFTMLYERWSEVSGTSIKFNVSLEDPNFNSEKKSNFYISNIDINKTTQRLTLTWSGEAPVNLGTKSVISTGKYDIRSPNGNFSVWWRSPNKSSNMSLNTHPEATFAIKYDGHRATHFYPSVPPYPASGGCSRIQKESFAATIWTFSQVENTEVKVHGIWSGHQKK
jgi:RHS repeat-associated protein